MLSTVLSRFSPLIKKEFQNYFKFLVRRWQVPCFLFSFSRFTWARVFKFNVSAEYKHLDINRSLSFNPEIENFRSIFPVSRDFKDKSTDGPDRICLAGQSLQIETADIWHHEFGDIEDEFSLHRFGWLLFWLSQTVSKNRLEKIEQLICSWIDSCPPGPAAKGWDSYSISERMINWIYFLIYADQFLVLEKTRHQKIIDSLCVQIEHLTRNLEFRYSGTNNHLINNARALYLTGACLNHEAALSMGRDILLSCSQKMFTVSGFLNEGSSHYQVLMARTFFEVFLCAGYIKDHLFLEKIQPLAGQILKRAVYFCDTSPMPAFGDVSPDFPPEFHLSWLRKISSGSHKDQAGSEKDTVSWADLFDKKELDEAGKTLFKTDTENRPVQVYPDAGHYKICMGDYTLYLYVNPMGYVPEWSHGHSDIGGFVLYWKQAPVLIDAGRYDFTKTVLGMYGRSARSHNSICIDGFEPCLTHGLNGYAQLMTDKYIGRPPEVSLEQNQDKIIVKIKYSGFKRLSSDIEAERTFLCKKDGLEIEDRIKGTSQRQVETFFHLHPDIDIAEHPKDSLVFSGPDCFSLSWACQDKNNAGLQIFNGKNGSLPSGWYFPQYGQKRSTSTLVYTRRPENVHRQTYVLKELITDDHSSGNSQE